MAHVAVARTKKSGARPALVFRHIVSLLVCFVSHGFASVSHPKFLFRFEAKQAKLGVSFAISLQKVSLRFASVSLRSEIRGQTRRQETGEGSLTSYPKNYYTDNLLSDLLNFLRMLIAIAGSATFLDRQGHCLWSSQDLAEMKHVLRGGHLLFEPFCFGYRTQFLILYQITLCCA